MRAETTAFASDFDGTLCESDWETGEERFAQENLEAVRRYQAAGGLFGISTGRPLASITRSLSGILDLDFYVVTTGAQVLGRDLAPWHEAEIARDVAQDLLDRYAAADISLLAVTDVAFTAVGRPFGDRLPTAASLDEVAGRLFGVSLECHGDEERAARVCADLNERYRGVLEGFQNLGSVDVVRSGCSKGAGVGIAKEALGAGVMAGIGDSYNDLALLAAADVAFTFHTAPEVVRAAADYVVGSVAEAIDVLLAL